MADNARDGWGKFDIAIKAIAALLIPVVILLVSQWYASQQKKADEDRLKQEQAAAEAQQNSDRVTLLLSHLASENTRERLLALKFVEYLVQSGQFPEALLPAVLSMVNDQVPEVAHDASHTFEEVLNKSPDLARSVEQAAQTNSETRQSVQKAVTLNPDLKRIIKVSPIGTNDQ